VGGDIDIKALVVEAWTKWADGDHGRAAFGLIDESVVWTVTGSTAASGQYTSKSDAIERLLRPIGEKLDGRVTAHLGSVLADGDRVAVEFGGTATRRTGKPYNQTYCWVMRFDGERIVEITAYVDTALVAEVLADP